MRRSVRLNMDPLKRFGKALDADLRQGRNGPLRQALTRVGKVYLGAMAERFNDLSRGASGWAPLAPSTVAARVRQPQARANAKVRGQLAAGLITPAQAKVQRLKIRRSTRGTQQKALRPLGSSTLRYLAASLGMSILRDKGILMNALTPNAPGNAFKKIENGVRVGIGGPAAHQGGPATIADIALFHQGGLGHNPRRQIIVEPDAAIGHQMSNLVGAALTKMANNT